MKMRDYIEQNIENIDPDLILEAAMEKKQPESIIIIKRRNDLIKRISTTAACIVFSAVVIIAFILMRNSITNAPADGVTEYFTDNETVPTVETEDTADTTEPVTETDTEPPVDTEPIPEELPTTLDFWGDRNEIIKAELSLENAWESHINILRACAKAYHPECAEADVNGPEAVKNLYLCDDLSSYDDFGYDHHIQLQFWNLTFDNGESYYYIIYEYRKTLIGIEECSADTVYGLEYAFLYVKEDERFKDTIISKLSENDYDRDDEVISHNLSTFPELSDIIRSYPSPLGYSHVFDFIKYENGTVTAVLRITTAEKQTVYYSFLFDTVKSSVTDIMKHDLLSELYVHRLGYVPTNRDFFGATYFESSKLRVYGDEYGNYYAENKLTGKTYLLFSDVPVEDTGSETPVDSSSVTSDANDTQSGIGSVTPPDTERTDPEEISADTSADTGTDAEPPAEGELTDETLPDETDTPEEAYRMFVSRSELYLDRFIIYEISDRYGVLGVSVFDVDTESEYYFEGLSLVSLVGSRVYLKNSESVGLYDYLSYLPLDKADGGVYEILTSVDVDGALSYSISPDGMTVAALYTTSFAGKEYLIAVTNVETGEVYEYYFTDMPRADIRSDFGLWSDTHFITGSEETAEFDCHIYLIPIK